MPGIDDLLGKCIVEKKINDENFDALYKNDKNTLIYFICEKEICRKM